MRVLLVVLAAGLLTSAAFAVDDTGSDPNHYTYFPPLGDRQCTVLIYGDAMGEIGRLTGVGYTCTIGFDLSLGVISAYDVVMIPLVGPGTITGYQDDIDQYVSGGGGLWIHQPNAVGAIDYAPTGFGFTVPDNFWCDPPDANHIVDAGHPTMAGLSDVDLPGRFDTVTSLPGVYTITAMGTGGCASHIHSGAGTYGNGRVFMDVANCSFSSIDPGSDQYIINVVDWLCSGQPVATEPTSWGSVKALYR